MPRSPARPRESGDLERDNWIPACAGMSGRKNILLQFCAGVWLALCYNGCVASLPDFAAFELGNDSTLFGPWTLSFGVIAGGVARGARHASTGRRSVARRSCATDCLRAAGGLP